MPPKLAPLVESRGTALREIPARVSAFCASVNSDAFMRFRSSPSQGNLAEKSSFKRSSFQGAEHLRLPLRSNAL